VLRTGSKGLAALTLVFDVGKGVVAALIAARWGTDAMLAAGAAVILGHMFPVWLGFRGGKGVATALGVLIAVAWPVALVAGLVWLTVAILFRYSSLAALVAAVVAAACAGFVVDLPRAVLVAGIALVIIVRHHENIRRLIAGTESRNLVQEGLRRPWPRASSTPEERLDWLRLSRTETIGPVTFYALLRRFGSARAAIAAVPRLGRRDIAAHGRAAAERELTALTRLGARLVCWANRHTPRPSPRSRTRRRC